METLPATVRRIKTFVAAAAKSGEDNQLQYLIADMKEPASLNLKTSHAGRRADISVLEGTMGDLKFSAPGTDRSYT